MGWIIIARYIIVGNRGGGYIIVDRPRGATCFEMNGCCNIREMEGRCAGFFCNNSERRFRANGSNILLSFFSFLAKDHSYRPCRQSSLEASSLRLSSLFPWNSGSTSALHIWYNTHLGC